MKHALAIALVVAACTTVDPKPAPQACASDPAVTDAKWQVLLDPDVSKGALFGVWGSSRADVWAVGATDTRHPELGPQVIHWDGKIWTRHKTSATGELWWVAAGATPGTLWMVGSGGQIVRRTSNGNFVVSLAPAAIQLYGVFSVSDSDVFAVGGVAGCTGGSSCGVIWHYDGTAWGSVAGLDDKLLGAATWFKVWGSGPDLWIVGSEGHILHRSGGVWAAQTSGVTDTILTVAGNAQLRIAVGGFGAGLLLEDTGKGWQTPQIVGAPAGLNGVMVPAGGRAVAVGFGGNVWRRCDGRWIKDLLVTDLTSDLHAVWRAPTGEVFAVGGNLLTPPYAAGALLYYGAPIAKGPL